MTVQTPTASPLFLREDEIRRGVELLYFGYSHMTRAIDQTLAQQGLGRAHHRALYFISRQPGLTVSELLKLLAITKQSLGRVLNDLFERGYIQSTTRSEEHTSELQSLMRISYAVFCLKKKHKTTLHIQLNLANKQ